MMGVECDVSEMCLRYVLSEAQEVLRVRGDQIKEA
jgi:hypothetical protein